MGVYHSITSVSLTKCSVCLITVSPVKFNNEFGSMNYVPKKKKSNYPCLNHLKPAAQTNTSIQGQKELNPSSIESFLSKSTGGSTSQPETKSKKKNLKNEKMK